MLNKDFMDQTELQTKHKEKNVKLDFLKIKKSMYQKKAVKL